MFCYEQRWQSALFPLQDGRNVIISEWIFRWPTEKEMNSDYLTIYIILHYFNLYLLMQDKGTINYRHWNKPQMKTWFYSPVIKLSKCPIWQSEANRMIKFALLMELKSAFAVSWMGITWLIESAVAWKNANSIVHPNYKIIYPIPLIVSHLLKMFTELTE